MTYSKKEQRGKKAQKKQHKKTKRRLDHWALVVKHNKPMQSDAFARFVQSTRTPLCGLLSCG
jgi:hypothetical protein